MEEERRYRIFDFIDTYARGGAILGFFLPGKKKQQNQNAASRFSFGLPWAGQFKIYV